MTKEENNKYISEFLKNIRYYCIKRDCENCIFSDKYLNCVFSGFPHEWKIERIENIKESEE